MTFPQQPPFGQQPQQQYGQQPPPFGQQAQQPFPQQFPQPGPAQSPFPPLPAQKGLPAKLQRLAEALRDPQRRAKTIAKIAFGVLGCALAVFLLILLIMWAVIGIGYLSDYLHTH